MEDYIYSDVGPTSNIHGELGLINIPSSRILKEGNLKLHLVNSDPINSLLITAVPFNWMEVSLRYADINTEKYSDIKAFSGDQTRKDKSFNLKIKLIEETDIYPELSFGFRDFIGTGRFSGEYIVSSKRVGDFDFTVGVGWGSLSSKDGIKNPFIDVDERFLERGSRFSTGGGNFELDSWFSGKKVSAFYGVEYVNKYSGLRLKIDYDPSNSFDLYKTSDYSFGLSIPASNLIDINLFKHRGVDFGFGISYKANYSKSLVKKQEIIPIVNFSEKDKTLLSLNDKVFSGTINALLAPYGIYTQEIFLKDNAINLIVNNSKYRNQNIATKRIVQLIEEVLVTRNIEKVTITYQIADINTNSYSFSLNKFKSYLENSYSRLELNNFSKNENFFDQNNELNQIFLGKINFPNYSWGISPNLKNHIGAPEAFYSGQIGILASGDISLSKNSFFEGILGLNIANNVDQLKLRAYSRLPKVRSDIREYLRQGKYSINKLTYSKIFQPIYRKNGILISGLKVGLFEEMFGGIGAEVLYRDVSKPWTITVNYYWVKQRQFNQRFSFREYETFTGHLNFIWDTPFEGVRVILSGGRYLARDSGITLNLSKQFRSGFKVGFFATKTDISAEEFGEGSFDKGIYFSIPIDLVSKNYQKNNARFVWRNLTRDGGAMLGGGLHLDGYTDSTSSKLLNFFRDEK